MNLHRPVLVPSSEEAVINVHISIPDFFQAIPDHGVCLLHYQSVTYIHPVSVPGTPTHDGRFMAYMVLCRNIDACTQCKCQKQNFHIKRISMAKIYFSDDFRLLCYAELHGGI